MALLQLGILDVTVDLDGQDTLNISIVFSKAYSV